MALYNYKKTEIKCSLNDYHAPKAGEWSMNNSVQSNKDGVTLLDVFAVIAIVGAGLLVLI